ncbi:MAG: serine--tRNA ligase, partial [Rothia mucilaginosa]|nr:serine--tRNA ligase [Rothia mucilaginosa]
MFRTSQRARGKDEAHVDRILETDAARRASIGTYENLRAEQNAFGKQVAKAPKEEKPGLVAQAKELAAHVANAKAASEAKTAEYEELLSSIENLI